MLYALYAISMLLCFGVNFLNKNEKYKYFRIFVISITFVFMWILLGWASGAYDVNIGISRYKNPENYETFTEFGYDFLIHVGHFFNIDYRTFFVLCSLFELIVLFWFIKKYCDEPQIPLLLFMIFPFVIYFQYIRNIMAFSFLMIAFSFLIDKKKFYWLFFLIFVFIASTIHISSAFFALILPFFIVKKRYSFGLIVLLLILFITPGIKNELHNILISFLGETKNGIVEIEAAGKSNGSITLTYSLSCIEFFVFYIVLSRFYKIEEDNYSKFIFSINVVSLSFIPLIYDFYPAFARLAFFIYIFNFVYYYRSFSKINWKERFILYFVLLSTLILHLYLMYSSELYREAVFIPFFENF